MAELKTQKTDASVDAFLESIADEGRRADARAVAALMGEVAGASPAMWGAAIVGFGHRRLRYDNGREIDWMVVGFSPRKANLALYLPGSLEPRQPLLDRLGKYETGKGCLYVKRLADVDLAVLREIVATAVQDVID